MNTNETRDRCEDLLDSLLFNSRVTAYSYRIDLTSCISQQRANSKKHPKLDAQYSFYHDVQDVLKQHGYVEQNAYKWEDVQPVVAEMEALAATLSLSRDLES